MDTGFDSRVDPITIGVRGVQINSESFRASGFSGTMSMMSTGRFDAID